MARNSNRILDEMEADHLVRMLADRLDQIAPPGFRGVAMGAKLHYASRFGNAATDIRANFHHDKPLAERVRSVCQLAVDDFQDVVDETAAEPWPGTGGQPTGACRGARIVGAHDQAFPWECH